MAAGGVGGLILLVMTFVLTKKASSTPSWTVSCPDPASDCYGILHSCPSTCLNWCEVDCHTCLVQCACDQPGAVCQDPRFIGGDGIMFYFHGEKEKDFCIVSDPHLHINAHFIGKRGLGMTRDFTWVQSLGILFGPHQLFVGAKTVALWDDDVDALSLALDGEAITLPPRKWAMWSSSSLGLQVMRIQGRNAISLQVARSFKMEAHVVPISRQESKVHKYNITSENCYAHLEIHFQFNNLSTTVAGVLGQTYSRGYRSPVRVGVPMPIMSGHAKFRSSSLMSSDCSVSKFGKMVDSPPYEIIRNASPVKCDGRKKSGRGFVCRQ